MSVLFSHLTSPNLAFEPDALARAAQRDRWADVRLTKAWRSVVLRSLTILLLTAFSMAGTGFVASGAGLRPPHPGNGVGLPALGPPARAALCSGRVVGCA